jgi:recombinational DNA repair protein RecT
MSTATEPKRQSRDVSVATGTPGTAVAFRQLATRMAGDLLTTWVGEDRAGEAIGRIATALSASAASAKKPDDFYSCTPASIATCVAIAALTGIMPGHGSTALAYLIPRSPRRGEQKQLGFAFSHRGLNALARRSGQMMKAVPIGLNDRIKVSVDGDVDVQELDIDNPPTEYEDLRGVLVVVKNLNGTVMARGWMPKVLIDRRRDSSDSYTYACKPGNEWAKDSDPWHQWPVEMAMKTAMHYAIGRGWCVIDDTSSVRALASDISVQSITVDSQPTRRLPAPTGLDELTDRINADSDSHEAEKQPTQQPPEPETPKFNPAGSTDEWSAFKSALEKAVAAKSISDVKTAHKFWHDKLPDRREEINTACDEAELTIRESRGERSNKKPTQGKLMDTNETA